MPCVTPITQQPYVRVKPYEGTKLTAVSAGRPEDGDDDGAGISRNLRWIRDKPSGTNPESSKGQEGG